MPALQPEVLSLTVNNHFDFEPVSVQNGLATYQGVRYDVDPLTGDSVVINDSPVLTPTMTVSLQKPSKTSRISKMRIKIVVPEPVFDAGVATKAKDHENSIDVTIISSERATVAERENLFGLLARAIANSTFQTVGIENKSIY